MRKGAWELKQEAEDRVAREIADGLKNLPPDLFDNIIEMLVLHVYETELKAIGTRLELARLQFERARKQAQP